MYHEMWRCQPNLGHCVTWPFTAELALISFACFHCDYAAVTEEVQRAMFKDCGTGLSDLKLNVKKWTITHSLSYKTVHFLVDITSKQTHVRLREAITHQHQHCFFYCYIAISGNSSISLCTISFFSRPHQSSWNLYNIRKCLKEEIQFQLQSCTHPREQVVSYLINYWRLISFPNGCHLLQYWNWNSKERHHWTVIMCSCVHSMYIYMYLCVIFYNSFPHIWEGCCSHA